MRLYPQSLVDVQYSRSSVSSVLTVAAGCTAQMNSGGCRELSHPKSYSFSRAAHNQWLVTTAQRPHPKAPAQNNSEGPSQLQSSLWGQPRPRNGYTAAQRLLSPSSVLPFPLQVFISRALPQ